MCSRSAGSQLHAGGVSCSDDIADRLVSITQADTSVIGFTFNAAGHHATRTSGGATIDTYWYLGASDVVALDTPSSGPAVKAVIDAMGDRLASCTDSAGSAWIIADLHGNVAGQTNLSGSSFIDVFRYDAYGGAIGSSGGSSSVPSPWRFQGRIVESSAGSTAYDFDARSYVPDLGTFTSLDTVAGSAQNPLTLNRYLYANANPATLVDPDGHETRLYDWDESISETAKTACGPSSDPAHGVCHAPAGWRMRKSDPKTTAQEPPTQTSGQPTSGGPAAEITASGPAGGPAGEVATGRSIPDRLRLHVLFRGSDTPCDYAEDPLCVPSSGVVGGHRGALAFSGGSIVGSDATGYWILPDPDFTGVGAKPYHLAENGFDYKDAAARQAFRDQLQAVYEHPDRVRVGPWYENAGGEANALFSESGGDLLLLHSDGRYWSYMKGGANNSRYLRATPLSSSSTPDEATANPPMPPTVDDGLPAPEGGLDPKIPDLPEGPLEFFE